ncbi:type II secretion system protein GspG [bacterium]|nr:type II secretion system protein GspG [bacterium]
MTPTSPRSPSRRSAPPRATREAGFTLAELLVVMVILGLLAAIVGPRLMGAVLGGAKHRTAQTQVANFAATLDLFRISVGRYPTTQEGLNALVADPGGAAGWAGPYLTKSTVPVDPWGNPYQYEALSDGAAFRITSLGADNAVGGEGENADIVSDQ